MLVKSNKIGIKTKVAAGLVTVLAITSLSAPAKAFNLLQTIAGTLGYGDLYTSLDGLYSSVSGLTADIDALAKDIGSTASKGVLGMIDINSLGQEALDAFVANPPNPDDPLDISSRVGRAQAVIAAKMGGGILTKKGQEQTTKQLQQQEDFATAASNAVDTALAADNSLEVAQQNTIAVGAMSQQVKSLSAMTIQSGQTAAASVTIQQASNQELSKINNSFDQTSRENDARIRSLGKIPMPGFGGF